jgi:hypothetical protein
VLASVYAAAAFHPLWNKNIFTVLVKSIAPYAYDVETMIFLESA